MGSRARHQWVITSSIATVSTHTPGARWLDFLWLSDHPSVDRARRAAPLQSKPQRPTDAETVVPLCHR